MLSELPGKWPQLQGTVQAGASFLEVLRTLQSVRFGIDLPGIGELCFRLHECLALGTKVVRPTPGQIAVPRGLEAVVVRDPAELRDYQPDTVRAVYKALYSPRAAAAWFLAGVRSRAACRV